MAIELKKQDNYTEENKYKRKLDKISNDLFYFQISIIGILILGSILVLFTRVEKSAIFTGLFLGLIGYVFSLHRRLNCTESEEVGNMDFNKAIVSVILSDKLSDNFLISSKSKIHLEDRSEQLDYLVISPAGLLVIKTENHNGKLKGHVNDEKWLQITEEQENGQEKEVDNPLHRVEKQSEILNNFIQKNNLSFRREDIYSLAVLVDKDCDLEIEGDTSSLVFVQDLPEKIETKLSSNQYNSLEIIKLVSKLKLKIPENYSID